MEAANSDYTCEPWSCRSFDEDECRRQVVRSLQEHHSTIYACVFLPAEALADGGGLLAAAYSNGDVRLFNWQGVCRTWCESHRAHQAHVLSWRGHRGPVYAAVLLEAPGAGLLLATAGDDGFVRLWRVGELTAAAAAAAAAGTAAAEGVGASVRAAAEVQLPHTQNPLGVSEGSQPAAQALASDPEQQRLFAGASDGGVHSLDVAKLLLAAGAQQQGPPALQTAAAALQTARPGHAAAVLCVDYCAATQQLASGSEDGTVRLWDCTHECAAPRCEAVFSPEEEATVSLDSAVDLLRCVTGPPVCCVKFDGGGNWLVAGSGAGELVLWNCALQSLARRVSTGGCIPQALLLAPGQVVVAGTGRKVLQMSFLLEELRSVAAGAESVFGLAQDPRSGMLAVAGSRGCLDLLSPHGASLGLVRPPPSALVG